MVTAINEAVEFEAKENDYQTRKSATYTVPLHTIPMSVAPRIRRQQTMNANIAISVDTHGKNAANASAMKASKLPPEYQTGNAIESAKNQVIKSKNVAN